VITPADDRRAIHCALHDPTADNLTVPQIQFHGENAPALPVIRKGKSGRVLLRRQRDYPAATVADFSTAVLTEAQRPAIEIVEAQQSDLAGAQAMAIGDQK
jgi:hypothetical protein